MTDQYIKPEELRVGQTVEIIHAGVYEGFPYENAVSGRVMERDSLGVHVGCQWVNADARNDDSGSVTIRLIEDVQLPTYDPRTQIVVDKEALPKSFLTPQRLAEHLRENVLKVFLDHDSMAYKDLVAYVDAIEKGMTRDD